MEPYSASQNSEPRYARRIPRHDGGHRGDVELSFATPLTGPLVIGDGRFLGLGLMAPATDLVPSLHAYAITDGLMRTPNPIDVARALRRAVMARVQSVIDSRKRLDPFFSGHAEDGTPIRRTRSSHLSFAFEAETRRLLIISPHILEHRAPTAQELEHLRTLDFALEGLRELRAASAGLLTLRRIGITGHDEGDTLLGRSKVWKTITPYVVTRHAKRHTATEALAADVLTECRRFDLPTPKIESFDVRGVPGLGLMGNVAFRFERDVTGPLLLGRTRHLGGGLFRAVDDFDPL